MNKNTRILAQLGAGLVEQIGGFIVAIRNMRELIAYLPISDQEQFARLEYVARFAYESWNQAVYADCPPIDSIEASCQLDPTELTRQELNALMNDVRYLIYLYHGAITQTVPVSYFDFVMELEKQARIARLRLLQGGNE